MIFVKYVEIIMDFKLPLLVIDSRGVSIIPALFWTCRVKHSMLIKVRVEMDNGELNFVQSLVWDLGNPKEFWNGFENKNHIREVIYRVS
jgi:hypothetical protein